MISAKQINSHPVGMMLTSDDLLEYHASRVLLLIRICGRKIRGTNLRRIEGLTKLAKLDFFVRYPDFFRRASLHLNKSAEVPDLSGDAGMIRFHYGPWDSRYYEVLPFLRARNLIHVEKVNNRYEFKITEQGMDITEKLIQSNPFNTTVEIMNQVALVLSRMSGNRIKQMIYELFDEEIANKRLGEAINE